jgi:hypothetical protein
MTIAAERLAVIAALTLPITSLSSVMGMNVIVNESTRWIPLIILLLIMLAISLTLLRWAANRVGGDHPSSAVCCRPNGCPPAARVLHRSCAEGPDKPTTR